MEEENQTINEKNENQTIEKRDHEAISIYSISSPITKHARFFNDQMATQVDNFYQTQFRSMQVRSICHIQCRLGFIAPQVPLKRRS